MIIEVNGNLSQKARNFFEGVTNGGTILDFIDSMLIGGFTDTIKVSGYGEEQSFVVTREVIHIIEGDNITRIEANDFKNLNHMFESLQE